MNPNNDIFQGLSILLLSEDDARGRALAKALRDQRARVGDASVSRERDVGRGVDLAVVDARSELACAPQLAALRADVRGRWASVVTIDYEMLVKADGSVLLASLSERVAPLVEGDRLLTERARNETSFSTSLAPLGPPRTLRALSLSGHTLFVELRTRTLDALVEVANELLVSASATRGEKRWEAWSALVRILGLSDCEVTVSRRSFTSLMNIMEPVDQALEVAAQERQCSADQIATEEAEAEARSTASHKLAPRPAAAAPAPSAQRPSPPTAPMRPVGSLGHQRTLMGVASGLPAPSIAANDVRPSPKPLEAPRYAHRPGQAAGPKAGMTLMGVAPSAIPGLSELRAQTAASRAKALELELRGAEPEPAKKAPSSLDFDPPTARHNVASLPDLTDELPDLEEDLSLSARPLSSPLPPPSRERDDIEREPITQPAGDAYFEEDVLDQTSITPSHLTAALLAEAMESANTEPPPAEALTTPPSPPASTLEVAQRELPAEEPPTPQERPHKSAPPVPEPEPEPEPQPEAAAPEAAPESSASEETLVVHRKPEKAKPKLAAIAALVVLVGLLALLFQTALRSNESGKAAPIAVTAKPLPPTQRAEPTPAAIAAPETPATVVAAAAQQPAIQAAPPAAIAPLVPLAEAPPAAPPEPALAADAPIEDVEPALVEPAAIVAPAEPASAPAAEPTTAAGADAAALLKKAQALLARRDAAAARPLFERALALQADNPHVRAGLAETLLKLNELPLALAQAQTAVKLRPKRGRYLVLQGDVQAAMGKLNEARAAYARALELDPGDADAKRKLGQ